MANNMTHISTSTVRAAAGDHHSDFNRRIELTPSDFLCLFFNYIQRGLIFHKPNNGDITSLVEHLKATLSLALDLFYPLAGRLTAVEHDDGQTASFSVSCNGAGAFFVHAITGGIAVADVLGPVFVPVEIVDSFFPLNGVLNYDAAVSDLPLLAVQVTELVDGVFIACSMNHVVADGTSFWNFFNAWSEISRGDRAVSQRFCPSFGREYLDGVVDLPLRIPFGFDKIPGRSIPQALLQKRVFHFSREKIAELKAKANAEVETTYNEISSLQALIAHLWVCVTRSRHLSTGDRVSYTMMVGLRPRLQPPLPGSYFGNATRPVTVRCTAGELLKGGVGWVAWRINRAIAAQTAAEARKFFEDWTAIRHQRRLQSPLLEWPPNMLVTGSSPRFDVYGNDFGWGRPIAVQSGPANSADGMLTVFPGAKEGSIDFEAILIPETLRALASDAEFMESLAT